MKKLFFLLLLLGITGSLAYLLGTEKGRAQRDVLLVKMGRGSPSPVATSGNGAEPEPAEALDS